MGGPRKRMRRELLGAGFSAAVAASTSDAVETRNRRGKAKPPLVAVLAQIDRLGVNNGRFLIIVDTFRLDLRTDPPTESEALDIAVSIDGGSVATMTAALASNLRTVFGNLFGVPADRVAVWIV